MPSSEKVSYLRVSESRILFTDCPDLNPHFPVRTLKDSGVGPLLPTLVIKYAVVTTMTPRITDPRYPAQPWFGREGRLLPGLLSREPASCLPKMQKHLHLLKHYTVKPRLCRATLPSESVLCVDEFREYCKVISPLCMCFSEILRSSQSFLTLSMGSAPCHPTPLLLSDVFLHTIGP